MAVGFLKFKVMKIKKLIKIFEKLVPMYQKCVDDNLGDYSISESDLRFGLCHAASSIGEELCDLFFRVTGYYGVYLNRSHMYMFPVGTKKGCKKRLNFLKEQIPILEKLLEDGYTHL